VSNFIHYYAECLYAECLYTECRGAPKGQKMFCGANSKISIISLDAIIIKGREDHNKLKGETQHKCQISEINIKSCITNVF
jgi:hypothetical protein